MSSAENNPPTFPHGLPLLDENAEGTLTPQPEILIVTGMSGAGRSCAARALEDLDWYVVDNLPPRMLSALAPMMTADGGGVHRLAAVVDVRSGEFFKDLASVLDGLSTQGITYRLLFLEASDAVLVRRYESVRRPHPLQEDGRILDGIRRERELLKPLRNRADALIDTTDMNVHELARHMRDVVADEGDSQHGWMTVMSFGFKHGIPLDADHVADVRFLANPYWVSELRHLTGLDEPVANYVLDQEGAKRFADGYIELLAPVMEGYLSELKPFVNIAIGCTGGRHRSVAITEYVAAGLRAKGLPVKTMHRDMGRE